MSKDEILVKKMPTSLHEKKTVCRQWTLILIFCVDVHMGLDPPPCGRHKWMAPYCFTTASHVVFQVLSRIQIQLFKAPAVALN